MASRDLTPTEQRVAELAALGRRNEEVAAELGLCAKTVEGHLTRVYRKLGVRSRTELAALAAGRGFPWAERPIVKSGVSGNDAPDAEEGVGE